jgi:hypothetical protein
VLEVDDEGVDVYPSTWNGEVGLRNISPCCQASGNDDEKHR